MAVTPRLSAVYAPDDSSGSRSTRGEFSTATLALKAFTLLHDAAASAANNQEHEQHTGGVLNDSHSDTVRTQCQQCPTPTTAR
jgi:hypothetical protein